MPGKRAIFVWGTAVDEGGSRSERDPSVGVQPHFGLATLPD
jgi:hypothetical protein